MSRHATPGLGPFCCLHCVLRPLCSEGGLSAAQERDTEIFAECLVFTLEAKFWEGRQWEIDVSWILRSKPSSFIYYQLEVVIELLCSSVY